MEGVWPSRDEVEKVSGEVGGEDWVDEDGETLAEVGREAVVDVVVAGSAALGVDMSGEVVSWLLGLDMMGEVLIGFSD